MDVHKKEMRAHATVIKEGDWVSLNGSRGIVYSGKIKLILHGKTLRNGEPVEFYGKDKIRIKKPKKKKPKRRR